MAKLQTLSFTGSLLQRGFWLYVWEIETEKGERRLYVGRTGDSSSPHAQSPFNRLSQHLGFNKHANALRRQLLQVGVEPETCRSFEMVAYGPIFPEAATMVDHHPVRNKMAAIERALRDALQLAGYKVLNTVHCRHEPDIAQWRAVLDAFATRFPKLKTAIYEVSNEVHSCGSEVGPGIR